MSKSQKVYLSIKHHFLDEGEQAYDAFSWKKCDSKLTHHVTKEVAFEQSNLEFPEDWSQNAINIVAQKYFAGEMHSPAREHSLKQLINRVVDTITKHGIDKNYLSVQEAEIFNQELKYILVDQRASFNSPVWFNIGVEGRNQQSSACFILNVEDDMNSILDWYKEEGLIFKGGSGSGINLSKLRSSFEGLSTSAGSASGPVSFMRGADASAGAIKSGGKTRRAAKMVILNADHPDIEEFIECKSLEEKKARILAKNGFDMGVDGKDIVSVQYQNANNSVRVTDDFMEAVENDQDWDLKYVNREGVARSVKAKQLFRKIARAAWECADPGMQFDTTINKWHTTPKAGRINASNPCSEYMHLDNSSCNLASINLLKFLDDSGEFQVEDFCYTVDLVHLAQEILVGYSEYPTAKIARNSVNYRQLGLGYANLGALLMAQGLPYDSDTARNQAGAITALMTGRAYLMSAKVAQIVGPFAGFEADREACLRVLKMHREAVKELDSSLVSEHLYQSTMAMWNRAVDFADSHGIRNSQVSVLAPTGTISFMMDCDTTGIEPDLGLVKYKTLVGGGTMKFVNNTVRRALKTLRYTDKQIDEIVDYVSQNDSIMAAPHLSLEHQPVFACAIGDNVIDYIGHVKMMAAAQPFLSGAISKTVNMPEEATVEDVEKVYFESWRLGLKAIAIYRDNCKVDQPVSVTADDEEDEAEDKIIFKGAVRRELPGVRNSKTFKFKIAGQKGYVTVGEFEDKSPGEVFIVIAKQGSTMAGIMDALAVSISHGLQYGVPLKSYVKAFINMSFAPNGLTSDPDIRMASSILDYIFRRIALSYLVHDDLVELGVINHKDQLAKQLQQQTSLLNPKQDDEKPQASEPKDNESDDHSNSGDVIGINKSVALEGPMCTICGHQTQRSGSCFVCLSCGTTTGCS